MGQAQRPTHVYLDAAGSTRLDPRVAEAMARAEAGAWGNASAAHRAGVAAARVLERARATLAAALEAEPDEVHLTSGGTEANNLAVKGVMLAAGLRGHVVVSALEHPSVWRAAEWLARFGVETTTVAPGADGVVRAQAVGEALRPQTRLVSVLLGSNETGAVQPIAAIARVCRERGVLLHVDACQGFTRVPLPPRGEGPDLVSVDAQKIHGPKGSGALLVRRGAAVEPLLHGGGQEGGLRSGTPAVALAAGLARAVELAGPAEAAATAALRDAFERRLRGLAPGVRINGAGGERLPHICSATLPGADAKTLLQRLGSRGIVVAAGSACAATRNEPSRALLAMGLGAALACQTLRVSLDRWTTAGELEAAAAAIAQLAAQLREESDGTAAA